MFFNAFAACHYAFKAAIQLAAPCLADPRVQDDTKEEKGWPQERWQEESPPNSACKELEKLPGCSPAVQLSLHKVREADESMGVAYVRTSSFGKKVQGSRARQVQQACAAASLQG